MRLLVDTNGVTFMVTKEPVEKTDQNGRQKTDRNTHEPLWVVQVMALDSTGGDMLNITVAGLPPKVNVGQQIRVSELEAIPWATNGKNGVAFKAQSLAPSSAGSSKAA